MAMSTDYQDLDWEGMWAPYDRQTYDFVLSHILSEDVVLDIGAGDLRLAREIAKLARRVYAFELQESLIRQTVINSPLPETLVCVVGNALWLPYPHGVSVGVMLMRHCTHYRQYVEKLRAVGAKRLITNARWRLGVEVIHLEQVGVDFDQVELGWYACKCGATGFKAGAPELVNQELMDTIYEVNNCPQCSYSV